MRVAWPLTWQSNARTRKGIAMKSTKLNSKGQVTVPKRIRDFLGIGPGSKVIFELAPNGDLVLRPCAASPLRRSAFAKLRGSATVKMRTDEILRLTRGNH